MFVFVLICLNTFFLKSQNYNLKQKKVKNNTTHILKLFENWFGKNDLEETTSNIACSLKNVSFLHNKMLTLICFKTHFRTSVLNDFHCGIDFV